MARNVKTIDEPMIEIMEMEVGQLTCHLLGTTPLIMHRADFKVLQELTLPSQKKNRAGLATTLKHDLIGEFRGSIYLNRNTGPTVTHFPSNAFGKALADAAVDIPGASRSQIQRLASCVSVNVAIYGIPKVFIRMVRLGDMKRTPDIRSRAIFGLWCCEVTFKYAKSLIKDRQVANLMGAAGLICGIGDWRPQRGGDYGQWSLVNKDNKDIAELMKHCGAKAQMKAITSPTCYDEDSEQLLNWYQAETKKREILVPSDKFALFDDDSGFMTDAPPANVSYAKIKHNKKMPVGKPNGRARHVEIEAGR